MFRVDVPIRAARSEPRFLVDSGDLAPPRLSLLAAPDANTASTDRPKPAVRLRRPLPGSPLPFDGEKPVASIERRWRLGPVASLILHLMPLLLLLDWPMHQPVEVTPIPVHLVFQPPPPPKEAPKPKPKPETRTPPGRIASEDMGATAKGRDQAKADARAAAKEPAATMESRLEMPERTALLPPPPSLPDPPKLDLLKPPEPRPVAAPKPLPKPSIAARQPVRRVPQSAHASPRPARYPGPAATRDEYLAYLAYLARQHIGLLSRSLIGGRRGETVISVLVLDDGTVAMLSVGTSSGYPDIDERIEQMIRAVGRFPPLPQWYQAPAMWLEFRLQFPEALAD